MDAAARDWITSTLVDASARGHTSPSAVAFLLHQYLELDRADIRDALEQGLTAALHGVGDARDPVERCRWLGVLAEAAAWSEDERLPQAVQAEFASTIETLEQHVRMSYEPGEGLIGHGAGDHVRCAMALLTAFELTGRLPYSMLAEELTQTVRRQWWSESRASIPDDVASTCIAIQLFCRLAALHRDEDYAQSAVVHQDASYEADARAAWPSLATAYRDHPDAAAEYGVALIVWFALNAP